MTDNHLSSAAIDSILNGLLGNPFATPHASQPTVAREPVPNVPFPNPPAPQPQPQQVHSEPQRNPAQTTPVRVTHTARIAQYNNNEYRQRFSGAQWAETIANKTVSVIGVGGIGSWTALLLARFGVANVLLVDNDTVENSNISGQLYRLQDVGAPKVDAISWTIGEYSDNVSVSTHMGRVTSETGYSVIKEITVCGLDSMASRREVFNLWRRFIRGLRADERRKYLFIDGRLSFETLQVFAFRGDQEYYINKYATEYLFSDEEADSTICSMKQTSYMANMIASFISNVIVHDCMESPISTPFMIEYDSDLFDLRLLR